MPLLGELASLVQGTVSGNSQVEILGIAELQQAEPEHLSFFSNKRYQKYLKETRAGALLVDFDFDASLVSCPLIHSADPYLALAKISQLLYPPPHFSPGVEAGALVDEKASVDPSAVIRRGAIVEACAQIGPRSLINAGCYIGANVRIGKEVLLHPGVTVLERCVIGDRSILHAGVVIGSDGFGYAVNEQKHRYKIPHVGIVEIEADVEIGANSTIDRATFGKTIIGSGTKIDNLVQIAHNVQTGPHCVVVSQTGIAGSTTLGQRVVIGAQSGIVGHIHICSDTMLAARSGVSHTIRKPGIYAGVPVMEHRKWLKVKSLQKWLPIFRKKLIALEQRILSSDNPSKSEH